MYQSDVTTEQLFITRQKLLEPVDPGVGKFDNPLASTITGYFFLCFYCLTRGMREKSLPSSEDFSRLAVLKAKIWAQADAIRGQIAEMGISLEDGPKGGTRRPA